MKCNFENCGYYTDGECNICGMGIDGEDTFCRLCKDNPNCYYKQNEKLKQDIEAYKQSEQEASEIIAELKAENERLKEEIKEVKKYQYEQEYLEKEIETAKVNLDIGKEEARHYLHEAYKFQKCLQEIKEYINSQGIDNSWNMRIQRFRMGILDLITKAEEE